VRSVHFLAVWICGQQNANCELETGSRYLYLFFVSFEITGRAKNKRITMSEVADLAGVSYQTVSRVVNEMPDVAPRTRERVLKLLSEVGYRPNLTARELANQKSSVVGVVTFGTRYHGPTQIMVNIEQAAKEMGFSVMFTGIVEESIDEIRRAVTELCSHQVRGVLIHLPIEIELRHLEKVCRDIHLVAVDSDFGFKTASVFVNQELGSRLATRHLIELGHQRIGYLGAPLIWRAAKLRYNGWRKELAAHRLAESGNFEADWTAAGGFSVTRNLIIKHREEISALVVANDQMAIGAIRAFEEQGIRVPDDISIVGFDDIPEAGFIRPPLTTIKQDFARLGKLSVQCLVDQLNGKVWRDQTIRPNLIERSTTVNR
jgi:DNA-binding LacI/PurR family transcriptional regulator